MSHSRYFGHVLGGAAIFCMCYHTFRMASFSMVAKVLSFFALKIFGIKLLYPKGKLNYFQISLKVTILTFI